MFTRMVHCDPKAGKREEVAHTISREVIPTLQRQPGFVDLITLSDNTREERVICVSFWTGQAEADNYTLNHYERIVSLLKPYLRTDPVVETFRVEDSTFHRISAGKAA